MFERDADDKTFRRLQDAIDLDVVVEALAGTRSIVVRDKVGDGVLVLDVTTVVAAPAAMTVFGGYDVIGDGVLVIITPTATRPTMTGEFLLGTCFFLQMARVRKDSSSSSSSWFWSSMGDSGDNEFSNSFLACLASCEAWRQRSTLL